MASPDRPPAPPARPLELIEARRFSLDGFEITVFVEGVDAAAERLALAPAQRAIVDLVASGLNNRAIAARLGVSEATVRKRLEAAYRLLGVHSRAELALLLQEERLRAK